MSRPWFPLPALLLSVGVLSNCAAPTYHRLSPELEIPVLGPGKAATLSAEKRTQLFPAVWKDQSINLALHEYGTGRRGRVLLMLHGGFADHETWRFIAGDLSKFYDLLLVDFPGCGQSDHPIPNKSPDDFFSPHATAELVLQAVDQALKSRQHYPNEIALVGHSLGGTVALQMFHDEIRPGHLNVMNRVDQLVLFTPMDLSLTEPDPDLERFINAKAWQIHLANSIGLLKEMGAKAMRDSMYDPSKAPREEVDRGVRMLVKKGLRKGAQAQLDQAFQWETDGSPDWDYINSRLTAYNNVDVPVLVVWGEKDDTLPVSMGRKIASEIPGSRLQIFEDAKHSIHVEYPDRSLAIIRSAIP